MELPKNEKTHRNPTEALKLWIYGQPNIGKTTFAAQFPNALMLNTDGNIKYVDTPALTIADSGALSAWEVFVTTVDSISKGNHDYETIVVDLLEDVYQYCRVYYNKKLKIDHEADLGFGKGYDIVRQAFIIVLRKLVNSPYNVVLISHEGTKTVKSRTGIETTVFETPLPSKLAGRVEGITEITGRISVLNSKNDQGEDIEERILYVNSSGDQFGGNKVPGLNVDYIKLSYNALLEALTGEVAPQKEEVKKEEEVKIEPVVRVRRDRK